MDSKMKYIAIATALLILTSLLLSIFAFIKISSFGSVINKVKKDTKKQITDFRSELFEKYGKSIMSLSSMGRVGPPGQAGPQGQPGGEYAGNGFLTNNFAKKIVDTTAGRGPTAFAYLNNKSFTPTQHWTLENDGKITNKKTGYCLVGNNQTNNVYMDICNQQQPNDIRYTWLNTGQLQFAGNREKCLGIKKFPYQNKTVQKIALEQCKDNPTAEQTFFIG